MPSSNPSNSCSKYEHRCMCWIQALSDLDILGGCKRGPSILIHSHAGKACHPKIASAGVSEICGCTSWSYFVRGQKWAEGYKKGFGIFCFCCQSEVSPSQFEAHAGWASRRKPYLHIYTSNGVSLHELSLKLSQLRKLSAEENDDLCSICADGGDLLCCDNCPRAFHTGSV
ncbi:Increased DNA methylation 1 [Camellia lanceoleosa]|uniref:Increased DNA methylation 1 n=1 Tax=Camellia lanceoleosa TaxID=1840588 RepID=A0ACC0FGX5_9ERIC|nr:Increased DNA methylation 1 [Camellia lanceoleosa]